jgi:hypothetical protein
MYLQTDSEPRSTPGKSRRGPGLTLARDRHELLVRLVGQPPRGTVMVETSGLWVAYVRLEDPPGLSPITTVGRFAIVDKA